METSQKDGGTRSGLLWEFERILSECKELGYEHLPQILVMENVPQIHSEKDMPSFRKWILRLEELGYTNYWEDLNAKDYGIPQNRERTIMVSILRDKDGNEYNYKFPKPFKRELVLKDMLEDNVDEKYYLSQRMIKYITATNDKWTGNNDKAVVNRDIGCTLNTAPTSRRCDASNYICDELPGNTDLREITNLFENGCKGVNRRTGAVYDAKGVSPTLLARNQGDNGFIAVDTNNKALNETLKNNEVKDGDFIDAYNRKVKSDVAGTITTRVDASNDTFVVEKYKEYMEENDGKIPEMFNPYNKAEVKDIAPTQTTMCGRKSSSASVLITETQKIPLKRGYDCEVKPDSDNPDGIDVVGNYSKSNYIQTSIVGKNGLAPTVTENHGQVTAITEEYDGTYDYAQSDTLRPTEKDRYHKDNEVSGAILASENQNGVAFHPYYATNLRIRKLTPKEAGRLMAFQDIDTDNMYAIGLTNSALYHVYGDSICVNVLIAVFSKFFNCNTEQLIRDYIKTIKN